MKKRVQVNRCLVLSANPRIELLVAHIPRKNHWLSFRLHFLSPVTYLTLIAG